MTLPPCPPEHRHGAASTCYTKHGCRCFPCAIGQSRRVAQRRALNASGAQLRVPAAPVAAHVAHLRAHGMGLRTISARAEISTTVLSRLIHPGSARSTTWVQRMTALRILAVAPDIDLLAPRALIPSRGARRRVKALQTLGWSLAALARRSGRRGQNFAATFAAPQVRVGTHRDIAALYDDLWNTAPSTGTVHEARVARMVAARAARRSYAPPLAWDDIDLDPAPATGDHDETAVDDVAVDLALTGTPIRIRGADLTAYVTRAHALGVSRNDMIRITRSERGVDAILGGLREERASA